MHPPIGLSDIHQPVKRRSAPGTSPGRAPVVSPDSPLPDPVPLLDMVSESPTSPKESAPLMEVEMSAPLPSLKVMLSGVSAPEHDSSKSVVNPIEHR